MLQQLVSYLNMFSWLEPFNLFPYTQLWRVKRQPEHHNKCAIITSIILILAIGALFIQRLIVVFNKNTMTATTQTRVSQTPPITTLSTHMKTYKDNPPGHQPFMIALDWYAGNPQFSDIDSYPPDIVSWRSTLSGPYVRSRLGHNDTIQFEPCSPQHFSMFPNMQREFHKWEAERWMCLPLNKTYTIEGSYGFDNVFSRVCLMLNCSGSCMDNFQDYNFRIYTLSSLVNPTNSTAPIQFFLQETVLPISREVHQEYAFDMTENYIQTDQSIFPWESLKTQSSISLDEYRFIQRNVTANESSTFIYFHRSYKTIQYESKFLQLIDAISFVGGIFEVIIGVFAFMLIFGRIFFEFNFARTYFKTEATRHFGFRKLVEQQTYKLLKNMHRAPDWQRAEERDQYQETVNHMLDIAYLQKRLDTLQRALPILLEEHQLKGLYLAEPKDRQKTQQTFKKHQLRDQMIDYLNRKKLKQEDPGRRRDGGLASQPLVRLGGDRGGGLDEHPRSSVSLEERPRHMRISAEQEGPEVLPRPLDSQRNLLMRQESIQERKKYDQNKEVYEELLKSAAQMLVNSDYEPITEKQLKEKVLPDLLKLFNEAEGPASDPRSKKIFQNIEEWLKELLRQLSKREEFIAQQKRGNANRGSDLEHHRR